ncbi:MAG TPA: alpha/beta hydrolase [Rubrivivax sp.]|nr:alpha/beta hydrolase [Rubrivivax sp.]
MNDHVDPVAPPSRELQWLEWRAPYELAAFLALQPWLRLAPRGDGHPVLVLPGLAADDASTRPLRAFLRSHGWTAHGWGLGRNRGPRPGVEAAMQQRLAGLYERHGRKVSVIGWSLGGIYARELARRRPEQVRGVITLGSPFAGQPRASNARHLYEALSGQKSNDYPGRDTLHHPPPVPSTAIYSRSDGVVAWQGCRERDSPTTENIEVQGSHCGLGHHPAAVYAIADRLAQPQDRWQPFRRSGIKALWYADPQRDLAAA